MKNRKSSPTILCAIVLSLVLVPARFSAAEPGDADSGATDSAATTAPAAAPVLTYTVARGDTLTSIAHKFGMTLTQLKRLNNLPTTKVGVKHGQILQVVSLNGVVPAATAALTTKKKTHVATASSSAPSSYVMAQPVQNFDLPTGTSSSSTETATSSDDSGAYTPPAATIRHAPIAQLVSPHELSAEEARQAKAAPVVTTPAADSTPTVTVLTAPSASSKHPEQRVIVNETTGAPALPAATAPQLHLNSRTPNAAARNNPFFVPTSTDWGSRFLLEARQLGNEGIEYDEEWRPPGEPHPWAMDCSNTARYIYKVTAGIELPRTASDQYYYLHLQGKAWDVPQAANGWADTNFLRRNLKPGDLLFWENTYRPERQPPITHVMVFLGTNAQGQWIMAGSQTSRGGEHNRRNGGPDIYVFRPSQPCGGYTTWLGLVHHQGRFCAFGRPLEADRTKLSVADD